MSKQYANGIWFKTIQTKFGDIFQANIKLEDFIASAKEVVNQDGNVIVQFKKSRDTDKYYAEFQILEQSSASNQNSGNYNRGNSGNNNSGGNNRQNYSNSGNNNQSNSGNNRGNSGYNRGNQGNNRY